jgi:hypothetical protein
MTHDFPWSPRRASGAVTLQEWMAGVDDRLNRMSSADKGLGSTFWKDDAHWDESQFRSVASYTPGWRRLQDSRIELRGQLERGSWNTDHSVFTPAPLTNGTVLLRLPFICSPPTNRQKRTAVMALAPCTSEGSNPGVFRVDIQREAQWYEEVVVDEDGQPVRGEDGKIVTVVTSKVEVIARPPQNIPITGWVSLEGVIYEPHAYLDALAPVPPDQEPLVGEPGWAIKQHPDGKVQWFRPGIQYSST